MFETPITIVGHLTDDPKRRATATGDVVKFRIASNSRRRAADGTWESGNALFVNVNCWGRLVTGVAGSLKKGDGVIVTGAVHTNEYEDRDGNRRQSLELRASAVGPDLARCVATLRRLEGPYREVTETAARAADEVRVDEVAGEDEVDDEGDDDPLALSA